MSDQPRPQPKESMDIQLVSSQTFAMGVVLHSRTIDVYWMTDTELDGVESGPNRLAVYLALLGISVGAFITIAVTLATVEIKSAYAFAAFIAVLAVSGLLSVGLGLLTRIEWESMKAQIAKIRKRTVPVTEVVPELPSELPSDH